MAVRTVTKRSAGKGRGEKLNVGWQPGEHSLHRLLLEAVLKDNPIPFAYRINYVAVRDGSASTEGRYGLTGLPETYYLNANGRVVSPLR